MAENKISVSEEEVDEYLEQYQEDFTGLDETEAREEVKNILTDQKTQQEINVMIQDLRAKAQITINFPGQSQQ